MHRDWVLLAVAVLAVLALARTLVPLDLVRSVLAVPALLLLPGYSWVRALRRRTAWAPEAAEGVAVGVALSFVGLSVAGVMLSALSIALTTTSWALVVAALTVPALAALLAPYGGEKGAEAEPAGDPAPPRPRPPALGATLMAVLLVAAAIAGAEAVTLRSDAVHRAPMTELGLQRTTGSRGKQQLAVNVRNREGRDMAYSLRIRTGAGVVARFERRLAADALWVERIDLDDERYRGAEIRALLFRSDEPRIPYRSVRIAPYASSMPPPCAAVDTRSGEVVCATPSAVLTPVSEREPLRLPGIEARVLGSTDTGAALAVRLRLRNTSNRSRSFVGDGPIYLSMAGRRLRGVTNGSAPTLAPGQAAFFRVRFGPDAAIRGAIARGERADLGITPPMASAPQRVAGVRLAPTRP